MPKTAGLGASMAEESEGSDAGAEASGAGVDPAAVALALNGASRERADAFLKKQEALIEDQRHHLHEQFKQLRLNIWQQRLGVLLRIGTGFVGLAIAAGIAFMIWDASRSSGLLIEPFSVPPDLAARGMTGEVVAAKLLDQLSQMQAETNSARAAQSYTNDWGRSGLKLDIPETGISFTELNDFLREKLGHDTHITGEIVRTASGVSLTARAGGAGAQSATGSEADLDALMQKSAESIYRLTQPFRYGMYLASHDRVVEAIAVFQAVAKSGSRLDRAWAYPYWALLVGEEDGVAAELPLLQKALEQEPDNLQAYLVAGTAHDRTGLPEQAQRDWKEVFRLLSNDRLGMYSAAAASRLKPEAQAQLDLETGDFHDAAQEQAIYIRSAPAAAPIVSAALAGVEAGAHDLAAARAALSDTASYQLDFQHGATILQIIRATMLIDSEAQNWDGVLSDANAIAPMLQKYPGMRSFLPTVTAPLMAQAEARLGRMPAAEARIAATPADCYDCLITRARIAELEGQHAQADGWFARAIDGQKSIFFAYAYWGEALLARGQPDAAIAKFTIANQKGPKFADALEGWGEALMKKNQSHLALAKFAEAEKYAPNWGRLHLKWGEALGYAGRKDEAQKQYALAAGLDLSAADKAELMKQSQSKT